MVSGHSKPSEFCTHYNREKNYYLSLFLPNFKIIRKDRDEAGGGVAIAIRKKIPFHIISLPIFKSLEIIGISLKINNSPYIAYSTYIPCQSKTALNELQQTKRTNIFSSKIQ
ncbi:hypothetical protein J437_LFUL011749, partial [Ladona fulva]